MDFPQYKQISFGIEKLWLNYESLITEIIASRKQSTLISFGIDHPITSAIKSLWCPNVCIEIVLPCLEDS